MELVFPSSQMNDTQRNIRKNVNAIPIVFPRERKEEINTGNKTRSIRATESWRNPRSRKAGEMRETEPASSPNVLRRHSAREAGAGQHPESRESEGV